MQSTVDYCDHYPYLRHYALKHGGNEDMVQEVYVALYQVSQRGMKLRDPNAWLYKVLRTTIRRHCSGRTVSQKHEKCLDSLPVDKDGCISVPVRHERNSMLAAERTVDRAIDQLSPADRTVMRLEMRGLPQQEIAGILKISHACARQRIKRATNRLKKVLETSLSLSL